MMSRYMYNMKLEVSERGQISGEVNIPILQVLSSSLVHIYFNFNFIVADDSLPTSCGLAWLASFKKNSDVLQ